MKETLRRAWTSFLVGAVLALAGWVGISAFFEQRSQRLRAASLASQRQREATWVMEARQRKLAAQQAEQVRLQRQREEMLEAFGGPVAAAAKNPRVDIAGMLKSVAEQCAGGRRGTGVAVDRFTEFTLTIALEEADADAAKAPTEIARCILGQVGGYVHRLRFLRRGMVAAELDRRAIESIPVWSQASTDDVQALLASLGAAAENPAGRSDEAGRMPAPDEERNLTRREQLQNEAFRQFSDAFTNAVNKVNYAIRQQDSVTALVDLRGVADLNAKQGLLAASERNLADAARFFSNPTEVYRRTLVAAGLDALFIETTLRARESADTSQSSLALAAIERAQNRSRSVGRLLQFMGQNLGNWSYDTGTRQVQFDSSATAANFRAETRQVEQDAAELEAAISRWSRESKR
jgi:hypothetical protein